MGGGTARAIARGGYGNASVDSAAAAASGSAANAPGQAGEGSQAGEGGQAGEGDHADEAQAGGTASLGRRSCVDNEAKAGGAAAEATSEGAGLWRHRARGAWEHEEGLSAEGGCFSVVFCSLNARVLHNVFNQLK